MFFQFGLCSTQTSHHKKKEASRNFPMKFIPKADLVSWWVVSRPEIPKARGTWRFISLGGGKMTSLGGRWSQVKGNHGWCLKRGRSPRNVDGCLFLEFHSDFVDDFWDFFWKEDWDQQHWLHSRSKNYGSGILNSSFRALFSIEPMVSVGKVGGQQARWCVAIWEMGETSWSSSSSSPWTECLGWMERLRI